MTGREPLPEDDPERVLADIEMVALATTWRCRHCAGRADVVWLGGRLPIGVEYHHEPGCPEHNDNL